MNSKVPGELIWRQLSVCENFDQKSFLANSTFKMDSFSSPLSKGGAAGKRPERTIPISCLGYISRAIRFYRLCFIFRQTSTPRCADNAAFYIPWGGKQLKVLTVLSLKLEYLKFYVFTSPLYIQSLTIIVTPKMKNRQTFDYGSQNRRFASKTISMRLRFNNCYALTNGFGVTNLLPFG